MENWRFNCECQLCKYQKNKNDEVYDNYMELMSKPFNEIAKKDAILCEEYLEQNKKKYNCYEMANAYLKLQQYYHIIREFDRVKKVSQLITKYADGKNYYFQLTNLNFLTLTMCVSNNPEFLMVYKELVKYMEKNTPLNSDEIEYLFRNVMKR